MEETYMVYVMSDIHGRLNRFEKMLKQIDLQQEDTLYILGDVIDRGPDSIKILQKIMQMENVIFLVGNHEYMMIECADFLLSEINEEIIGELDEKTLDAALDWMRIGGKVTIDEFKHLPVEERQDILDYISEGLIYQELTVGDQDYILVHGGLGNYNQLKTMDDYTLEELIWSRAEYDIEYFPDKYVVTGHTPTYLIAENDRPGYIYRKNNHIAIDCGCASRKGKLAAIRLDDGTEFYVD